MISRRVILSVAYAKSNCEAVRGVAEQDLGRDFALQENMSLFKSVLAKKIGKT